MIERCYSYVTLRYVHDPISEEFVNVGVVLFAPSVDGIPAVMLGRTTHRIGRFRAMFPGLERTAFTTAMQLIDRAIGRAKTRFERLDLLDDKLNISGIVGAVMPEDDSSLRWSSPASGISHSLEKTFERVYHRFVGKYETSAASRRSDDDVWRPVRDLLQAREINVPLESKVIVAADDTIEFKHAWKNGVWHAYEPLSLDLADADGIMEKARRWLGNLQSVQDATEHFVPHFILGAPTTPGLEDAFEKAKKVLGKADGVEVYEEGDIPQLVDHMAREYEMHAAGIAH
jgi:hypothetical protein